ncbi:MAG: hypothetical protein JO057_00330 [Chloroflexi bacterium]|nr:hypothetical protein [Chloroflexota bacterium]
MRFLPIFAAVLLAVSSLASPALAQEDQTPGDQSSPDAGPLLQPVDDAPAACDPSAPGFRYLEVRGTGFDGFTGQHLTAALVDGSGATQAQWPSIYVTPAGQLTLELNLCAEPLQNRAALAPGDYTVSVGASNGAQIAAAGITLQDPVAAAAMAQQAPASTSPLATPTPAPRTGPGSMQTPIGLGSAGQLVDNWQLGVLGVNPDAFGTIKAAIPSAVTQPSGNRDLLISLQATYAGTGTGTFDDSRLTLINPTTQAKYDQNNNNCGFIPSAISPNVVTPGTVVLGNVCFSVPASDIGSLMLVDNQPSQADRVYFALH